MSICTCSGVVEWHVIRVGEVGVAGRDTRRPAEVVDRDRRMPALGEAHRELLVEREEAANIRQHDDARGLGRTVGQRDEGLEPLAAVGLERLVAMADGGPCDRPGRAVANQTVRTSTTPPVVGRVYAATRSPSARGSRRR